MCCEECSDTVYFCEHLHCFPIRDMIYSPILVAFQLTFDSWYVSAWFLMDEKQCLDKKFCQEEK